MDSLPPLSPGAAEWFDHILAIPSTEKPMDHDLPAGLSAEEVEYCHHLAGSGDKKAVPYLLAMVRKYPDFRPLYTYLRGAYTNQGMDEKTMAIAEEMRRRFPDYLFARMAMAQGALFKGDPETALAELGGRYNLRELYPDRDVFHLTEIWHFHYLAAIIDCELGNADLAVGVLHAFQEIDAPANLSKAVLRAITRVAIAKLKMKMKEEDELVSVTPLPRAPRPVKTKPAVFQHPEIKLLHEVGSILSEQFIRSVLAHPRESLIEDLLLLIEDCRERSPNFLAGRARNEGKDAFIHAVHFLAEIEAKGTTPALLRFFSMHPKEVGFWMRNAFDFSASLATLLQDDTGDCFEWLKKPGIGSFCRGYIIGGLGELARRDPGRRDEIIRGFAALLEFYFQCPADAQILDARVVTEIVHELAELGARESLPLIREAYQRNLISLFRIGPLENVESKVLDPQPPRMQQPAPNMIDLHRKIAEDFIAGQEQADGGYDDSDIDTDEDIDIPSPARREWTPGRNDPCPCGSGKKYKKCCMP
jgi:hypothetical protein